MDNLIGDIFSTVKFKTVLYFKHGFCGTWGMEVKRGAFTQFHFVSGGSCLLYIEDLGEPFHLQKGDIVVFPRGAFHQLKDQEQAACVSGAEVVQQINQGEQPYSDGRESTNLICGHFEMDQSIRHPIIDKLPEYIIIKASEYGRFDLIQSILEMIIEELERKKVGYQMIAQRLAEILYISTLRHYYLRQSPDEVNLFKDELIGQAIELIHADLSTNWKIEDLAHQVGVSRTLFIERFKNAIGQTPFKYITNWRMNRAKYLLKNTDLQIPEIAESLGYQSETAFSRAFKQFSALAPGRFRRAI